MVVIVTIVLVHAAARVGWLLCLMAMQTLALGLTYLVIAYGDGAPALQVQTVRAQLATSWDRVAVFPRLIAALLLADCALMLVQFLQQDRQPARGG